MRQLQAGSREPNFGTMLGPIFMHDVTSFQTFVQGGVSSLPC